MSIKTRKHTLSLWIIATMIGVLSATAFAAYLTLTIPFNVTEPLEILDYPTTLNLYPGQTSNFTVTVRNNAPLSYAVFLDFSLDNATYRDRYVTVSNETYFVHPGTQSLAAWLAVSANAPSLNTALGLSFRREAVEDFAAEQIQITNMEFVTGHIYLTVNNTGTSTVTINEGWLNNAKRTDIKDNATSPGLFPLSWSPNAGKILDIPYTWTTGSSYQVKLISSKGNQFLYSATAVPQRTGQLQFDSLYADATTGKIRMYVRNVGGTDLNVTKIYVNGVETANNTAITSALLSVQTTIYLEVNYSMTKNYFYEVAVVCKDGTSISQSAQAN